MSYFNNSVSTAQVIQNQHTHGMMRVTDDSGGK